MTTAATFNTAAPKTRKPEFNDEFRFLKAASSGDKKVMENGFAICGKEILNAQDHNGWTAAALAAVNDRTDCLQFLIDKGADVNLPTNNGDTPLILATVNEKAASLRILIDGKADLEATGASFSSALDCAITANFEEGVEILLNAQAKPDGLNLIDTPLMTAIILGKTRCAQLLLAAGADVTRANRDNKTIYNLAREGGKPEMIHLIKKHINEQNRLEKEQQQIILRAREEDIAGYHQGTQYSITVHSGRLKLQKPERGAKP